MKWFKHMSNSHRDKTLKGVFRKHGLEGEARFWRLIELMAEAFENDDVSFDFELENLRESLRFRSLKDCRSFLDTLTILTDMIVEYSGNDCRITYDKLLDIKDNHSKNLQATTKRQTSNLPLEGEEEREKEEELEKESIVVKDSDTDYTHPLDLDPNKVNLPNGMEVVTDSRIPPGREFYLNSKSFAPKKRCATDVKDHRLKWFMDLFNDHCESHGMVRIKALSESRTKAIDKGIKAIGDDCQTWLKVFKVAGSKGFSKPNGDSWTPEFDYIFTKENYLKFSEADLSKKIINTTNGIDHLRDLAQSNPY